MRKGPFIKPNRMKVPDNLPSHEELTTLKQRKRVGLVNMLIIIILCDRNHKTFVTLVFIQ